MPDLIIQSDAVKMGVGGPLPRTNDRRSVGQGGEKSTYQHPRAKSSQVNNCYLHKVKDSKSDPHTKGQYTSTDILTENGGKRKAWK